MERVEGEERMKDWLKTIDITEAITVIALVVIAVFAMDMLKQRAQELTLAIASGLVGYLAKGNRS